MDSLIKFSTFPGFRRAHCTLDFDDFDVFVIQYLHSLMALTASDIDTSKTSQHNTRLEKIGMALEALRNVIKTNPGIDNYLDYFVALSASCFIV